jgi:hypothetical protein
MRKVFWMIWKNELWIKGAFVGVVTLVGIVFLSVACGANAPESDQGKEQGKNDHPAGKVIQDFHLPSYYAGSISTSAEFVSYGCKKLALSATFSDEELSVLLKHAEQKAIEHGIPIYVEKDLIVTKLFSPTVAKGKTVILFAYNQDVLDEYFAIKEFREKALAEGQLAEVEEEIAWRFGRLLSYTDETIARLMSENKQE